MMYQVMQVKKICRALDADERLHTVKGKLLSKILSNTEKTKATFLEKETKFLYSALGFAEYVFVSLLITTE
jgi:hypothetical protein